MKPAVLVLTNSEDGMHTDTVIAALRKRGERVFRMDSDRLATGELRVRYEANGNGSGFVFTDDSVALRSEEIGSVWYRRPNHFDLQIKDPVQKAYAERELSVFLEGLWTQVPADAFWMSKPGALERARKKILQLQIAREFGLRVPPTIVSNDPDAVRAFYAECGGEMIFKAIYHEFLNYGEESFNIPTTLIEAAHLAKLDLVRRTPSLFQKLLHKRYELRVTVVGERLFPVKIDSQKNPLTIVDWRHPEAIAKLDYSLVELDPALADACLGMLRRLDLAFGAFDFVCTTEGEMYFLEVNPNGQWYWLEDLTGALISEAIADTLKEKGGHRES